MYEFAIGKLIESNIDLETARVITEETKKRREKEKRMCHMFWNRTLERMS